MSVLRGLTWDHSRATVPLEAATAEFERQHPQHRIIWDRQPLAGFEFAPIADVARDYDLVVFDHPHIGEVAAGDLFVPLDAVVDAKHIQTTDFVGPSFSTYVFAGHTWALPLDAACQVQVARPDLLAHLDAAMPQSWEEVLALGAHAAQHGLKLAAGFAGVHSLMSLFTLTANLGAPLGSTPDGKAFDRAVATEALGMMQGLLQYCPTTAMDLNSIAVLDALRDADDLVLCPIVYGFSPYALIGQARPLHYGDLPGGAGMGPRGSTIGGAGLGVSALRPFVEVALQVAAFLTTDTVQRGIIAAHGGQPAHVAAWQYPEVNRISGNFYAATRATIDAAWVRPRFDGYMAFQRKGGELVETWLRSGDRATTKLLDALDDAWAEATRLID